MAGLDKRPIRTAVLLAAFVLGLGISRAEAQPVFRLPGSFPVGESPFDVLITDLDGDHHLDFLSTDFTDGTISVLLGTGTGDFLPLDPQPASSAPIKVVSLFADGDTNLDIVVSEGESDNIYLLRGHGDGTFGDPEPITGGHDPYALAAGDMNKDGKADVIQTVAAETGGRVNVMLGDGQGFFAFSEDNGQRLNAPSYGVIVGDFDEDQKLDVAATDIARSSGCDLQNCGTLAIMLGNGEGQLAEPVSYPCGPAPFALATADLDKDGHLDIVTGDSGDNFLSVFHGDGKGAFSRIQRVGVGVAPGSVVLVDLDGDGWLEAVVGNARSGDVSVVRGLPGGAFGGVRHFLSGIQVNAAGVGDFNEDERLDFLALNQGDTDPSASLLLAREDGGYDAIQSIMPTTESTGVAAGDIRGDGVPALALSVGSQGSVQMFFPEGVQQMRGPVPAVEQIVRPISTALRDLNEDGRADLVIASGTVPRLTVALATGEEAFTAPQTLTIAGIPAGLAVGDLDGDGHLDLMAPVGSPPALAVVFGNGDGTFAAPVSVTLGGRPGNIATGDFDGNGADDVAVGNAQTSVVSIVRSDATRNLSVSTLSVTAAPNNIACADFDADGLDDLVVGLGGSLRVFFGTGGAAFNPGPQLASGRPASGLAARDVTGDLRPDVLVTLQGTNNMAIFTNDGGRMFSRSEQYVLGLRPGSIAVADFDADGRYDVGVSGTNGWVITNDGTGAVVRRDGNGDGVFSAADLIALRAARARGGRVEDILRGGPGITAGTDANGDGLVDAADESFTLKKLFDL